MKNTLQPGEGVGGSVTQPTLVEIGDSIGPSPTSESKAGQLRQGFKWSFGTTAVQGVLQIAVTMTMARLLVPADYGLYAMVEVVIRWGNLLGCTGLATVLVQRLSMDDAHWKAARAMSWLYSGCLFVFVFAAAPLIARIFGQPDVIPLLRLASLSFLVNGIGLTAIALLRRRLHFGRLGLAETGGYLIGNGITAITLAHFGAGVWAVALGSLVGVLIQNCVAIAQARDDHGLMFERTIFRGLARQSVHVSANSILDMTNNTMDTFVVGRVFPQSTLGLFNRAGMLASLPTYFLWSAVSKVALPGYASLQGDSPALVNFFQATKKWSGTISVAVPLAMIPAAKPIVAFLLGPQWLQVVPILQPLLLAFALESLAVPYHSALDAIGRYGDRSKIRLCTIVLRVGLLAAAVYFHRPPIFYVAACIGFFTWIISVFPLARRLSVNPTFFFLGDFVILARAAACTVGVMIPALLLENRGLPTLGLLSACVAGGALPLAWIFRRELTAFALRSRHRLASKLSTPSIP